MKVKRLKVGKFIKYKKYKNIIYRVIQEESAILWEMIVCVILSKKSLYEHGSDFEQLLRYGKKKIRTILRA